MDTPTPPRRNRRSCIRRPGKRSTKANFYTGQFGLGRSSTAVVLNICETGVCLRVQSEFAPGQELELHLSSLCLSKPIRMPGEVVWCLPTADGEYHIGVHFRRAISFRDMQSL
jgi:PilZ domain-containing protein